MPFSATTSNHLEHLIRALAESGFLFSANDFDERRRAADQAATSDLVRKTLFWCNIATKFAVPVIESSRGPWTWNQIRSPNINGLPIILDSVFDIKSFEASLKASRQG